jgi:signal transduction histidine kinase
MQIIEEVLTFTRLQGGGFDVERSDVYVPQILDEVQAIIEPLAQQKGIEFSIRSNDAAQTLTTDARKLRQILLNLLGNAVKFTERGFVRLEIGQDVQGVYFRVTDSGIGIPSEQLPRIFDPFWQGDQSRTRPWGGTGLGLAISQRMAALLGGRISATSEFGKGSSFTLELSTAPMPDPIALTTPATPHNASV